MFACTVERADGATPWNGARCVVQLGDTVVTFVLSEGGDGGDEDTSVGGVGGGVVCVGGERYREIAVSWTTVDGAGVHAASHCPPDVAAMCAVPPPGTGPSPAPARARVRVLTLCCPGMPSGAVWVRRLLPPPAGWCARATAFAGAVFGEGAELHDALGCERLPRRERGGEAPELLVVAAPGCGAALGVWRLVASTDAAAAHRAWTGRGVLDVEPTLTDVRRLLCAGLASPEALSSATLAQLVRAEARSRARAVCDGFSCPRRARTLLL